MEEYEEYKTRIVNYQNTYKLTCIQEFIFLEEKFLLMGLLLFTSV